MKIRHLAILLFLGILGSAVLYAYRGDVRDFYKSLGKETLPQAKTISEITKAPVGVHVPQKNEPLPLEVNLAVPFSSQAPFANWDFPYKEACEEMSMILVHYFYQGKSITPELADEEILKMVEWQKKNFGDYQDTTAFETANILRKYFGYKKVIVRYDVTAEDIRKELAAGRPVIVPFAGRLLGNPNYRSPGPLYHMLVVKGYTKDGKFITNDVGTRRGKDFTYDEKIFMNAIHDFRPDITNGRLAIVTVYPNP